MTLRVIVVGAAGEAHRVGYAVPAAIKISCVDVEVLRAANLAGQISQNADRARVPVPVPDVVDLGCTQQNRSTVVIDIVSAGEPDAGGVTGGRAQHRVMSPVAPVIVGRFLAPSNF